MFSTAGQGFVRLPGRLSLDLAGGYTCPIKPAFADGRLFCRLSDKIVCYDLRRDPKRRSQAIELTAPGAFASSVERTDLVKLRVRLVDGVVSQVSAHWPEVVGREVQKISEKWVAGHKKPLQWRSYPAPDLTLGSETLRGEVRLPLGWHFEHWRLKLDRDGQKLNGAFVRSVPAIETPLGVSGDVSGSVFDVEEGWCYAVTLDAAATQVRRSQERRAVTVVVVSGRQGVRAWAAAGRINGMVHEVDPSKLTIGDGGAITGTVTVIFRDDPYFHLNEKDETSVAGTYQINAIIKDSAIRGTYSGTFGHAWSREGTISGHFVR
jgi:hypothetical protein